MDNRIDLKCHHPALRSPPLPPAVTSHASISLPLCSVPETIRSREHGPRDSKPRLVGCSDAADERKFPSFLKDVHRNWRCVCFVAGSKELWNTLDLIP